MRKSKCGKRQEKLYRQYVSCVVEGEERDEDEEASEEDEEASREDGEASGEDGEAFWEDEEEDFSS